MRNFHGDKLWLIPRPRPKQITPAQLADMEAHMSPLVAMWQNQGESLFTDFMQQLGS